MFCATKAESDCENAEGASMMKAQSFSATPTPAEAISPSELTMASMTRKDTLTSRSCSAMGAPSRSMRRRMGGWKRTFFLEKGKGRPRRRIASRQSATLTACANTVASAAPAAAM